MQPDNLPATSARMMQLITGFWTSCCIYAAAKLNIPDLLAEAPKTAGQLAQSTHTHEASVYRLMRTLSSMGIFHELDNKRFELTPNSQLLRSDVPGSLRAYSIMNLEFHFPAWGNLMHSITTGEIAFDQVYGENIWNFYEHHPEKAAIFNKAMSGLTDAIARNIIPAYDFTGLPTIVDLGGGNGALLCAILKAAPRSTGIVFDLDENIGNQANRNIQEHQLQDRCRFQAGSFFDSIPEAADAYLMKSVLHDWNDEDSIKILSNLRQFMSASSRLLIIENVIGEKNTPHPGNLMDMNMMVMTGGKERSAEEWQQLIAAAGLRFIRLIPTSSPMFSIVEAGK